VLASWWEGSGAGRHPREEVGVPQVGQSPTGAADRGPEGGERSLPRPETHQKGGFQRPDYGTC
jgi:hypothetical protein